MSAPTFKEIKQIMQDSWPAYAPKATERKCEVTSLPFAGYTDDDIEELYHQECLEPLHGIVPLPSNETESNYLTKE